MDLADEVAVTELINGVVAKPGALNILVNTVGGYVGGLTLWDTAPEVNEQMLTLNLRSGYLLTHAVLPMMLRFGRGSIVNVAAKGALDHAAGASAYAASKAAALALMDSLAADVKGTGIRVNSVLPSIIDTAASRKAMHGSDFSTWPKPEEIANVVLFLASDSAKVIHGAAVPVYGNS